MIIGIGIDIVKIDRIERMMTRWGNHFLGRIFTEKEIARCQKRAHPAGCFATRFAAKEAFLKAIGWGLRNGIRWTDIEVDNDPLGRPFVSPHRRAKKALQVQEIQKALLTLSHESTYAVAYVILEG
jgi:holo-[acyl-carrier protein] synthase